MPIADAALRNAYSQLVARPDLAKVAHDQPALMKGLEKLSRDLSDAAALLSFLQQGGRVEDLAERSGARAYGTAITDPSAAQRAAAFSGPASNLLDPEATKIKAQVLSNARALDPSFDAAAVSAKLHGFLGDYFRDHGVTGPAVIGLSGGIDSALSAAECKKAFGNDRVNCIILPTSLNDEGATRKAQRVAADLGLPTPKIVDLSKPFRALSKVLCPSGGEDDATKIRLGNMKARLRMITLMDSAAANKGLVVGTGNKSESMVGYSTKYGDGGADLQPLANILKTLLFQVADHDGIQPWLLATAPSAGLWEGQTDEGQLGITYKKLDQLLKCFTDGLDDEAIRKKTGLDQPEIDRIRGMVKGAAHKGKMPDTIPVDTGKGLVPEFHPEISGQLKAGIVSFFEKSKISGPAVLGLSGGIDSAIVAKLVADARGKDKLECVIMPTDDNDKSATDKALQLAKDLDLDTSKVRIVDLSKPYKEMVDALGVGWGDDDASRGRRGNIKARLRMLTLYDIAAEKKGAVMGTGNDIEIQLGYFTKFGDGGCDFLPIASLPKTIVWELSRHEKLPKWSVDQAPSANLWTGQTDEGQLGMSYPKMDQVLRGIGLGMDDEAIAKAVGGITAAQVAEKRQMRDRAEHKRIVPPSVDIGS